MEDFRAKIKFNLFDSNFSHDKYSVAGRDSKFIEWDRSCLNKKITTFFSHDFMFRNVEGFESPMGWFFESKSIIPNFYSKVESHLSKFKKVFTPNLEIVSKYENCFWSPGGGVWIGGSYGKGEIKIFNKKKLCSIVSSQKKMCNLHNFRLEIANSVDTKIVDVFGLKKWVPVNETLEDYMFSIVVENHQDELFFTEKILNCFATGTIPIYFGAKNIGEKFDNDGIITFSNKNELFEILNIISPELYYEKMNSIKNNFDLCQNYLSIEDYIYKNHII